MKKIEAIMYALLLAGGFALASISGLRENRTDYECLLMYDGLAAMVIGGGKLGRNLMEECERKSREEVYREILPGLDEMENDYKGQ
jgi:hypothetical protein